MNRIQLLWAQGLGLMLAAVIILIGAILPWYAVDSGLPNRFPAGEGHATFALGVTLFLAGALRLLAPRPQLDVAITMVAAGCAGAVLALAVPVLKDIQYGHNLMAYIVPNVGAGIKLTMAGGSLGGLSSLFGAALPFAREGTASAAGDLRG